MKLNQSEYFEANQVDGRLTDAQAMQLLTLPEGDTAKADSDVPDVAAVTKPADTAATSQPTPATTPAEPAATDPAQAEPANQVILAKDGIHTIPFEKLTEARNAEQHWKSVAQQAQEQLEALTKAPPAAKAPAVDPAGDTQPATGEDLFGDFSAEALQAGVEKVVAARVAVIAQDLEARFAAVVAPITEKAALTETDQHFAAIESKHPDFESVAQSQELASWIAKQPSFAQAGYNAVLQEGTAAQVVELLDTYKAATGKLVPPPAAQDTAAVAAAQAAIAKAQQKPPMSLTDIPSGSTVNPDPAQAMLEMSNAGVMSMFEGKTPEQINALMNRVI